MAAVAAGPVFRLLGAKDLGTSDNYKTEKMPAVNVVCWMANSPGGSTTVDIRTARIGSTSSRGLTSFSNAHRRKGKG